MREAFKTPLPPSAQSEALDRKYAFEYESGKWTFGSICVVRERASGDLKTVKTVPRKSLRSTSATLSNLLKLKAAELKHDHVNGITDVFDDQTSLYIVSNKSQGGDVGEWNQQILEHGHWLQEEACISYIRQALIALAHSHAYGVYHRELLPSSLLLTTRGHDACVLVSDLGLASSIDPENNATRDKQTPYTAPELRDLSQGQMPLNGFAADVWSIGAIAHELLAGRPPPSGEDWNFAASLFWKGEEDDGWSERSDEARDFVSRLLRPAERRPTAAKALQHPWLRASPERGLVPGDYQRKLVCYVLAVLLLPGLMPARDAAMFRLAFKQADLDGDGLLSVAEVRRVLIDKGGRVEAVSCATDIVDGDKLGILDLSSTVCAALVARHFQDRLPSKELEKHMMAKLFELYGTKGIVKPDELKAKLMTATGREMEDFHGIRFASMVDEFPEGAALDSSTLMELMVRGNGRGTPRGPPDELVFEDLDAWAPIGCETGLGLGTNPFDQLVTSVFRICALDFAEPGPRGRRKHSTIA